jgi:hypothetical protein
MYRGGRYAAGVIPLRAGIVAEFTPRHANRGMPHDQICTVDDRHTARDLDSLVASTRWALAPHASG